MENQAQRKKLIEEDSRFVSFPPPNYNQMTNEQIRKRTEIIKKTFELAFSEDDDFENDDDL